MQFQSDLLDVPVERPAILETTALGAAYLAGLAVGFWRDKREISSQTKIDRTFTNTMDNDTRSRLYLGWLKAVKATRTFTS